MALMKKELNFLIQTHNFDCFDNIKPTGVFELFQDIAALHAKDLGLGYEDMINKNMGWVILYETYEVIKMPEFLQMAKVITWPKPKGRIEFEREYLITDNFDNVLIKGISNWVVIDINTRSFVRSDKVDYNGEYYNETNYSEKVKRKLGLSKENITDWFELEAKADDLDHNLHMNNTRYLSYIYNYLPLKENYYCRKCEIAFIKEVKFKEKVKVGYYQMSDDSYAFIGFVDDNLCFESILYMEERK